MLNNFEQAKPLIKELRVLGEVVALYPVNRFQNKEIDPNFRRAIYLEIAKSYLGQEDKNYDDLPELLDNAKKEIEILQKGGKIQY